MESPTSPGGMPTPAALEGIMADLSQAMARMSDTQDRLMSLSGTAWSDDRTVKVVVGPRGQLVDLEIDPRAFRQPDAQRLRESILAAAKAAVAQVTTQVQEVLLGELPPEVAELREQFAPETSDPAAQILVSDADIITGREAHDDHIRRSP